MTTTAPLRAATYSRYSSDNQRDTSIEDQQRLTSARCAAEGWQPAAHYADQEISASTPVRLRPGGKQLLDAAERGAFDVLVIEALDRCWRDIVDQEQVLRRLEHLGIRIVGTSDGYDTRHEDRELQRGVRGLLNQQYLRDLAKKTHRGLTGQVFRGGHAGGLSYGYRSIDAGHVHQLEVDEDQARWVRWIYERFSEGWSCQRIASDLNHQGVKTGRGGTWSVSALYGSPNKGSGVLNNELYLGRYIWNRSHWVKNPDNGKRIRLVRPREEWIVEERPGLRIVPDDLWHTVRARMDGTRLAGGSKGKGARPKTLLGGLMRCGKCGAAVIAVSASTYGCTAHKDRGTAVCTGVRVSRPRTDRRMMTTIREDLLSQAAIVQFRQQVDLLLASSQKIDAGAEKTARAALTEVEREIDRLVNAIVAMGHSDALSARLRDAEARREMLHQQAAPKRVAPVKWKIEDIMARYKRHLTNLENDLAGEPERARAALKDYFGEITIEDAGDEAWASFAADPGRLLLQAAGDSGYGCGGSILFPATTRRVRLK
ncbi:MAG: recombinase family protein [Sterolibacterium sp.]|jgi:DNA invertase Pin-like site-specific DNA recombinase